MKDILKDILNEKEAPDAIREKLMQSAKRHLLLKDIGELFLSNNSKALGDLTQTILTINKTDKHNGTKS